MSGYAIKLNMGDGGAPLYLQNMSEYTTRGGDTDTYVFQSRGEAEVFAQNLELKSYEVVPYAREADDNNE